MKRIPVSDFTPHNLPELYLQTIYQAAMGRSNLETAAALGRSALSIKGRWSLIMRVTGLQTREQVVMLFFREGVFYCGDPAFAAPYGRGKEVSRDE